MKITIIGIGKLGGALAIALKDAGFEIDFLFSRNNENAGRIAEIVNARISPPENFDRIESDAIFITTQDAEIENVSRKLAENLISKPVIFHTSGALSSEILRGFDEKASFHPLVSVSDSLRGKDFFKNAFFCIEGTEKAVETGKTIAERLGGKPFSVKSEFKALYHASAVTASGHTVALFDASLEMLEKCGLNKTQAAEILMPLIESTFENLKRQTPENALTGTFARADFETFSRHLAKLKENVSENAVEIYLTLAARSVMLAEKIAANDETAQKLEKIRETLLLEKKTFRC